MNTSKKIVIALVALVVIGVIVYQSRVSEVETVKIGVLIPLTGKFATYGVDIQTALSIAERDIEQTSDLSLEFIYEDSAADPKTAVVAANKLVQIDKVPIVIGGPGSSVNLAIAPIMEESRTIFLVSSLTPKLNESGVYTLKFQQDIDGEVLKIVEYIKRFNYDKVAVLYDSSSDTLITAQEIFANEMSKSGTKITHLEGFESKTTSDYRSLLTKAKSSNSDALYLLATDKAAGAAIKQAREIGFTKPIYGMSGLDTYEFIRAAGDFSEGVTFTAYPFSCSRDMETESYCKKFKELLPSAEPIHYGPYSYDILNLVARAIEKHGFEKEKILEELISTKDYDGVSGKISLDSKGNLVDTEYVLKVVKNGKIELVD